MPPRKLKTTITFAQRKQLAALCEALGLPSSYFIEFENWLIEIKVPKPNGKERKQHEIGPRWTVYKKRRCGIALTSG